MLLPIKHYHIYHRDQSTYKEAVSSSTLFISHHYCMAIALHLTESGCYMEVAPMGHQYLVLFHCRYLYNNQIIDLPEGIFNNLTSLVDL